MKQNKLPNWLKRKWRNRIEAMSLVAVLTVTGAIPASIPSKVEAKEETVQNQDMESLDEREESEQETESRGEDIQEETTEEEVTEVQETEIEETEEEITEEDATAAGVGKLLLETNDVLARNEVEVAAPVGLVLNSPKDGVLTVVYGPSSTEGVTHYIIYIDGEVIKEDAGVAFYTFENIQAGEHIVEVTAVLEDGTESDKEGCRGSVTVGGTEPVEHEYVIAISESYQSVTSGEDITLTYQEDKDFANAIERVTVDGQSVDYDKTDKSVTIPGRYFGDAGVYHINVIAEGYQTADVYQTVYEEDIWELDFADEFNQEELDTNIWTYQNGTGAEYGLNGWGNDEQQYYTDDNISLQNGVMTIEAKKEARDGKSYTSGRIRSLAEGNEGYSTTYGRVEAKVKMPTGNGFWPAFWMLPSTDVYGTWAANGEIDIMEARGRLPHEVLGTIHYGETWPDNKSSGKTYTLPDNGSIDEYHVYALEWDVDFMSWYVDGREIYRTSSWYSKGEGNAAAFEYPAPFDEAFHIVFDLAVGGTFDGNLTPDDSDFENGAKMDVDYVRVYRNNTPGYYDREAIAPSVATDEETYQAFAEKYADENGNFVTDMTYSNVEKAAGVTTSDMKEGWSRHWYHLVGDYGGAASFTTRELEGSTYAVTDITSAGSQNYAVQLIQHLPLVKGYTYEVSFDAYASKDRSMIVKLAGDDDNGWGAYSNAFNPTLTATPQHYAYTFTMGGETDETARLEFNQGLDTGKVGIANVCVKTVEVTENPDEAKKPLADGNHVYNGTFDQGTGKLVYWNLDEEAKTSGSSVNTKRALALKIGSVSQIGIELLQADTYSLTLEAGGLDNMWITLSNQAGDRIYATKQCTLTEETSVYILEWTMPAGVSDTLAKLQIQAENSAVIDNVRLVRLTDNNVSYDDVKIYPMTNGDFEQGLTGWSEYTDSGAACATALTLQEENGNHYASVNGAKAAQPYYNMLMYTGISIQEGTKYDLMFRGKASSQQTIEVKMENASYTATMDEMVALENEWKDYKISFKASIGGAADLKFLLAAVTQQTNICIDDVELKISGVDMKKAPTLISNGAVKLGREVSLTYTEHPEWEQASKRVFVDDEQLEDNMYTINTIDNKITIAKEAFATAKTYTVKVIADGFDITTATQIIIDTATSESGSVAPDFSEWEHYVGGDWAYVASTIESMERNNIAVNVRADGGWGDTAWGVQLLKGEIPVTPGFSYKISFDAHATQNKMIGFKLEDATGNELTYTTYSLEAGKRETIEFTTEEMTGEFVKIYFALGVFPQETGINTTISINDFKMVNTKTETPEEEEQPEEEGDDTPEESRPVINVPNNNRSNEGRSTESSSSTRNTTQAVSVRDKLADVIFEALVPLAATTETAAVMSSYDISLYGTDAILTMADLQKIKNNNTILHAFLSDTAAITIHPSQLHTITADLHLGLQKDTTIDYGQGFSAVTFLAEKAAAIGFTVTMHMHIGEEYAGKVAYIFAQDMSTGTMQLQQTCIIDEIGNISYEADTITNMVILY